jgi:Flp pilus assembly protein TadG
LFGPNEPAEIVIEEDLTGVNVKGTGHFEFILQRKDKAVCVVEAKHYDLQNAMARGLVEMVVVSDVDDTMIKLKTMTTISTVN